jgi:signal recognition particle subunit SRP54
MFDSLSEKFENVFKGLRGEARLTEDNIKDAMREVRVALLDADVNYKVVKDFTKAVTAKAAGTETLRSVRPSQQIIKIVNDELVEMMGGQAAEFTLAQGQLQVIVLLGLQGAGKTTFAGKLALYCKTRGYKPLLVACDVYRPAAIRQLEVVGAGVDVPVFQRGTDVPVPQIASEGVVEAKKRGCDLVIVDTAGRLHIDEVKMDELTELKRQVKPKYTFLVADAMTGQDAVNSASAFHEGVGIDGVCLTKIDGDARGGAALSIRAVTGTPIYFVGTGEKSDDLEPFYPDRIASRILGMGDVVSLVERAQEGFDEKEAMALQKKMKREEFSLQDFLDQMQKVKKMGSLGSLMKMIPGMSSLTRGMEIDDDAFKPMEAMIHSMTPAEREDVDLIGSARRKRIAQGSGTSVSDINGLLDQFRQTRKMMSQVMKMGPRQAAAMARGGGSTAGSAGGGGEGALVKVKPKHRRKRVTKKDRKRKSR